MASKKKERLYTENMVCSMIGMTPVAVREILPQPTKTACNYQGWEVPAWKKSEVEQALQDPRVISFLDERKLKSRMEEIADYLKSFDFEEMVDRAKGLNRTFVLHIGPTNSGKTYEAIQHLKEADKGTYLCPLRLLALEIFDQLNMDGYPCSLLTGEEEISVPFSGLMASTVEMANYYESYDVAVIDEAQMLTDPYRGDRWLRAICCINAKEVHLCFAPEATEIILSLLKFFDAPYSIVNHERLAKLEFAGVLDSMEDVEPGDALIVFSRKSALALAADLEKAYIPASVIYGALPPASRREEVRRFREHETDVVVATDAIGMGLSLPIRRIIFCETTKYDGVKKRNISPEEIRQIAGRAGRYGIYNKGFVLTLHDQAMIEKALKEMPPQKKQLIVPFPTEALASDWPIDLLLYAWSKIPPVAGIRRVNMAASQLLYSLLVPFKDVLDRRTIYQMITCPFDETKKNLLNYWFACCKCIATGNPVPEPTCGTDSLEACEVRYRQLDIRYQLLRTIGIDENRMEEKMKLSETINHYIASGLWEYSRRCKICNCIISATASSGMCGKCKKEWKRRYYTHSASIRRYG